MPNTEIDGVSVPESTELAEGQSKSDKPTLVVRDDELQRFSGVSAGGRMSVAHAVRQILSTSGGGLDSNGSLIVLTCLERAEAEAEEARVEARTWQARASKMERENARLSAAEAHPHEKVRLVAGGVIASLGGTGIAFAFTLSGAAIVVVAAGSAFCFVAGVALIVVPWVPAWLSRRRQNRTR